MAYTLLDLRARVRAKIKDTSYPSATLDGFINDAIVEITDLYTFREMEKVVDGALTIGDYTFEQQDDHQTTRKLVCIDPDDPTRYFDITQNYMPSEAFFSVFPVPDAQDSTQPSYWTEYGNQFYFNAPVDKEYTVRQFYQKMPTELVAESDSPELPQNFREIIVLGAAYRCEEERGNFDIAGILQNRFNDRLSDLMMRFANNTLTGPDTVVTVGARTRSW